MTHDNTATLHPVRKLFCLIREQPASGNIYQRGGNGALRERSACRHIYREVCRKCWQGFILPYGAAASVSCAWDADHPPRKSTPAPNALRGMPTCWRIARTGDVPGSKSGSKGCTRQGRDGTGIPPGSTGTFQRGEASGAMNWRVERPYPGTDVSARRMRRRR